MITGCQESPPPPPPHPLYENPGGEKKEDPLKENIHTVLLLIVL